MILEIARIDVQPGTEAAFEAAVQQAAPLFQRARGCHGMQLQRVVEHPQQYLLIVQWETLEHHTVDFRESEDFTAWRGLVGGFFAGPPQVVHAATVAKHF